MTASEPVSAYERNLVTEDEAVEQAMAEDIRDVYRRSILELARRLHVHGDGFQRSPSC